MYVVRRSAGVRPNSISHGHWVNVNGDVTVVNSCVRVKVDVERESDALKVETISRAAYAHTRTRDKSIIHLIWTNILVYAVKQFVRMDGTYGGWRGPLMTL